MSPPVHATTSKSAQLSSIEIIKRRRSCRRLLFGEPNRQELDEWFAKNADRRAREAQSKWNFDFEHGVPLNTPMDGLENNGVQSSSSTYDYEKVDEKTVPQFYRSGAARKKLIRFRHAHLNLNGNAGESSSNKLSRSESTPVIGTKSPSRSQKKVTFQTNDTHAKHRTKSPIKSPKKKSPSKDVNKPKTSSKKFEHALPTKVF